MSFALVLKKTSWYRRRYSRPLRVNHLADAFIQSDVQMRRTIEAIRPSREQQYTSAMTSLS